MTLSQKMKYIVKELNITQDTFIKEIQKQNKEQSTTMSESSLKKIFSGQYDKNYKPSLTTIDKIICYLKSLKNSKIKYISYDYLLNDNNINLTNDNIKINELIGLNDETIENIKIINFNNTDILNRFINCIDKNFWGDIKLLDLIKEYHKLRKELKLVLEKLDIKNFNQNMLSSNEIYIQFSNNDTIKEMIKEYNILNNNINVDFDKIKELNMLIETYKKGKSFLEGSYILEQLKEHYTINNYIEEFIKISNILERKYILEKNILTQGFEMDEEDIDYNMVQEAVNLEEINFYINNGVCPTSDSWKVISKNFEFRKYDDLKKRLKYEINEKLTLYLNK